MIDGVDLFDLDVFAVADEEVVVVAPEGSVSTILTSSIVVQSMFDWLSSRRTR